MLPVTPGPDRGKDASSPADPAKRAGDDVVGEARWPMAGAVLAAMVLTILLPGTLRLGPPWALPLIEGGAARGRDRGGPSQDRSSLA
jgi:hypothetical protein